jgi:hypothetical protein
LFQECFDTRTRSCSTALPFVLFCLECRERCRQAFDLLTPLGELLADMLDFFLLLLQLPA